MKGNVIITGATGFVGSNIIRSLNSEFNFINLGRSNCDLCENVYWDLKGNLENTKFDEIDAVIHCASVVGNRTDSKADYIDINVKSTHQLLEFCSQNSIKKFIYVSTGGVYGFDDKELNENSECKPTDLYSMTKYFSEKLCDLYSKTIKIVILRLFFPYGEGQKGRLFSNLLHSILIGEEIHLNQNGSPIINPVHITDVVNIMRLILEKDCSGIYNISGDDLVSIEDLCCKMALYCNVEAPKLIHSSAVVNNLFGSNKKICSLIDYNMKIDIDTGIKLLVNSTRGEYNEP